ncbi:MAG: carboxylating nicotinate-nucleotide diphosphorylase [archaeon GB-1867-097]|nr:carboxylating nicotinate-nucleotide diphosphorylase [Candidatus Culexmicrobium thermophilum]
METLLKSKFLEWLREDVPFWDLTSTILIREELIAKAHVIAKEKGVAACMRDLKIILEDFGLKVNLKVDDGECFDENTILMELIGSARKILLLERLILNLLSHCCGVATATRKLVDYARSVNPKVKIAATRKTLPGLRYFEKRAVIAGGGDTHRLSLSDAIIIKDNHIFIFGDLYKAVSEAKRSASFTRKVEVEVKDPDEALKAAKAGADIIMLDNFSPSDVEVAVNLLKTSGLRDNIIIEVSGGIRPENVREYAKYDVDVISSGWITHSSKPIDISLKVVDLIR